MVDYIKHLIGCKCILPQFKYKTPKVYHSFVVFSIVENDGSISPSFAQCNNCGNIHKIVEIGKSIILKGKDELVSLETVEEIKDHIPEGIRNVLESYKCSLPTWQEAKFILENELWGRGIILDKETLEDTTTGKYLLIIGINTYKVNSFVREEYVNGI